MRPAKTHISLGICPVWSESSLGGCPGWSESSLGAHSFCWFCHVAAHIASIDIILSKQQTTKALIRLHVCTGWSVPLLFAYGIRHVFSRHGSFFIKIIRARWTLPFTKSEFAFLFVLNCFPAIIFSMFFLFIKIVLKILCFHENISKFLLQGLFIFWVSLRDKMEFSWKYF